MFNELIFTAHVFFMCLFVLFSLRLGKEALMGFVALQYILANLFVLKQITLFGLTATATDPFTVGAMLGLNIIQEYYGRDVTKKTIWIGFFLLIFYTLATILHLQYTPSPDDTMQPHFHAILGFMPRIAAASLIVYLIVQQLDVWIFGYLKKQYSGISLELRSAISVGISQLIDTILFTFLGLYGLIANPWHIIIISYIIKVITIGIAVPFLGLSKRFARRES